jgi:hypothetical protein
MGSGLLKGRHLGSQDEPLAAEDRLDCGHDLGADLSVFPGKIE